MPLINSEIASQTVPLHPARHGVAASRARRRVLHARRVEVARQPRSSY
jgi:hypothetical protein